MSEELLIALRSRVTAEMSEKRATHTLEVERMAERLAQLYCPEKTYVLRAAALLHDVTKELSPKEQVVLCTALGISLTEMDLAAPKTLHAMSAAALIPREYPEFDDGEIVSAVRWHTTGKAGMTLTQKLIYLADYIDMSRSFEDCVRLRNYFFDAVPEKMDMSERLLHLDRTLLMSFDMTLRALIDDGKPISEDTLGARNELAIKLRSIK